MSVYETKKVDGILLHANESPFPYSDTLQKQIIKTIQEVSFNRYPDDSSYALNKAYANYVNVDEKQIISGNGSDEMLGFMISMYIKKGLKLYTLTPDFSMYDYYVSLQDGKIVKFKNEVEDEFDVNAFIQKGKAENVAMILFSNPNNPTGKTINTSDILKMVEAFNDIPVIVDEAYGEFNDESMIPYIDTYENLYVTRTLSKAFASAAIRCGFLIGNKKSMEKLAPYKVPYNVNSITQKIGELIINANDEMYASVKYICDERERMYNAYLMMNRKDLILYPSKANYLYGKCKDLKLLKQKMETQNIQIRYYENNAFRITIGRKEDNDNVLEILQQY